MKYSLFVLLITVLMIQFIESNFGAVYGSPFGGSFGGHSNQGGRGGGGRGHRGHHNRRNEFSGEAILRKLDQMESYAQRYLDRAISAAQIRNSSDIQVLQELRNTDIPEFFTRMKQKLNNSLSSANSTAPPTATNITSDSPIDVINVQ